MFKKLNEEMQIIKMKENKRKDFIDSVMPKFVDIVKKHLEISELPKINLLDKTLEHTFGLFHPNRDTIDVVIVNRHPVDSLRTLAHELVHWKQKLADVLNDRSGEAGSEHENEANYLAGVIMRDFNHAHPECLKYEE